MARAPLLLIELERDDGVPGRAYAFGYTPVGPPALAAFLAADEAVVGALAAPRDFLREAEVRLRLLGLRGLQRMALAAVELALWDAAGSAADATVAELFGAAPRPLPAYDSLGVVRPDESEEWLRPSLDAGFEAVKIRLGHGSRDDDVASVRTAREIVGPGVRLMVDYNQSMTAPEAIARARAIADHDLFWLEEPVAAGDAAGHFAIRAAQPIP